MNPLYPVSVLICRVSDIHVHEQCFGFHFQVEPKMALPQTWTGEASLLPHSSWKAHSCCHDPWMHHVLVSKVNQQKYILAKNLHLVMELNQATIAQVENHQGCLYQS